MPSSATNLTSLARVINRMTRSTNPQVKFDTALLVCEAAIKLMAIVCVSLLRYYDEKKAHRAAYDLVRADSVGAWVKVVDQASNSLTRLPEPACRVLSRFFTQRMSITENGDQPLVRAWTNLEETLHLLDLLENGTQRSRRPNLVSLLNDLVMVRNKTRGHGAYTIEFYGPAVSSLEATAKDVAALASSVGHIKMVIDHDASGKPVALKMNGADPTQIVPCDIDGDIGSLWLELPDHNLVPLEPLMTIDLSDYGTAFANGAWSGSALTVEMINYETGKNDRKVLPRYASATEPPPSSTDGGELVWGKQAAHNLPPEVDRYIARKSPEEYLERLLLDDTHRLITMLGSGGSGKTSLALKVCHRLAQQQTPYTFILWISARDIDFLVEGPVARTRQVRDLRSAAEYCRRLVAEVIQPTAEPEDAALWFSQFLRNKDCTTLFIFDNFETLDDQVEVQRFLDENVRLPSKVLITSRHESFRGDFPISIVGMEEPEAKQLIKTEARHNHCEGRLDHKVVRRIMELADRTPYPMKILVAQFAAGQDIQQAYSRLMRHDQLLGALFDRSFDLLTRDGQFLYLLLAKARTLPEWLVEPLCTFMNYDFLPARDGLLQVSLAWRDVDKHGWEALRLSNFAVEHGRRVAIGHDLETDVDRSEHIVAAIYEHIHDQQDRALTKLFEAIEDKRTIGTLTWREAVALAELISQRNPQCWFSLALALEACGNDPDKTRSAYKHAVEEASTDGQIWRAFAGFEKAQGKDEPAIRYSVRAVTCLEEDVEYAVAVANDLNRWFTERKENMTHAHRETWAIGVARVLQRHRGELDATALSRLGWLYLNCSSREMDPTSERIRLARECAEDGLKLEASNDYCLRLKAAIRPTLNNLGSWAGL